MARKERAALEGTGPQRTELTVPDWLSAPLMLKPDLPPREKGPSSPARVEAAAFLLVPSKAPPPQGAREIQDAGGPENMHFTSAQGNQMHVDFENHEVKSMHLRSLKIWISIWTLLPAVL